MCPEDHIHETVFGHDPVNYTFLLRHTAADTQQQARLLQLQRFEMAQLPEYFILGILADGTGIQQNDIRIVPVFHGQIAHLLQHTLHRLGVMLIHLAAVGR
ncbi:hypothetical protein D3C80_1766740 [compost metagenome]